MLLFYAALPIMPYFSRLSCWVSVAGSSMHYVNNFYTMMSHGQTPKEARREKVT